MFCQGNMQNTMNCLLDNERHPLVINRKALEGHAAFFFLMDIFRWLENSLKEFAINSYHPRTSRRFTDHLTSLEDLNEE